MNDQTTNADHDSSVTAHPSGSNRRESVPVGRIVAATAAVSLLIGLIAGPIIANHSTSAATTPSATEHTITVSGSGDVSVAPDVADVILDLLHHHPRSLPSRVELRPSKPRK